MIGMLTCQTKGQTNVLLDIFRKHIFFHFFFLIFSDFFHPIDSKLSNCGGDYSSGFEDISLDFSKSDN